MPLTVKTFYQIIFWFNIVAVALWFFNLSNFGDSAKGFCGSYEPFLYLALFLAAAPAIGFFRPRLMIPIGVFLIVLDVYLLNRIGAPTFDGCPSLFPRRVQEAIFNIVHELTSRN